MKVDENTTLKQVIEEIGVFDKPWLIDPFVENDFSLLGDGKAREELYQFLGDRAFADLSLKEILYICKDWNLESMIDGLNELISESKRRKVIQDIWDLKDKEGNVSKEKTGLFSFPVPGAKKFVLICPGGGYYNVCTVAEGFPLAAALRKKGVASFILHYRTGKYAKYPNPVEDAAQAVKYIFDNKETYGLEGNNYAVMGFSAGGHLAAILGTENYGYKKYGLLRPEAVILGYPVVTMGDKTHLGSRNWLLADECTDPEIQKKLSVENNINMEYPLTYIWNCKDDYCVPCDNSRILASRLKENHVSVLYDTFPGQAHGWGLGLHTPAEGWLNRAVDFWKENG